MLAAKGLIDSSTAETIIAGLAALGGWIWGLKHRAGGVATVLIGLALIGGSMGSGCGHLEQTGVYAGDQFLYQTDFAIASSYDLLHTFVKWEYDNREVLSKTPEVKQFADVIRAGAPEWFRTAIALRDTYRSDPSQANREALQRALDVLRTAISESARYLARAPTGPQPGN